MQIMSALLRRGARLSGCARELTNDTNEAYLLVHRVMAEAMHTGADSDDELNISLTRHFACMRLAPG